MSQAGRLNINASSLPSNVLLQVTADDLTTAAPSSHNLNIISSFVNTNNNNGIRTTASGSSLTIQLTNRLTGSGSTTNAATSDLLPFSLASFPATYTFSFFIIGRETTTGDCFSAIITASAKTNGAIATIIQSPYFDIKTSASLSAVNVTFTASANTVNLNAIGVAGTSITYNVIGSYVTI